CQLRGAPALRGGVAVDHDLSRLHLLWKHLLQLNTEQAILEIRPANLDEIGELETPFEGAGCNAAIDIGVIVLSFGLAPGNDKLVLTSRDLDLIGPEPGKRQGDPVAVLFLLHDVEGRIAIRRLS